MEKKHGLSPMPRLKQTVTMISTASTKVNLHILCLGVIHIDPHFFGCYCFSFSDTLSLGGGERVSVSSTTTTSSTGDSNSNEAMSQSEGGLNDTKQQPDSIDSSADEGGGGGLLENCRILPSNCLPCLNPISVVPCVDKRRALSSSPPSSRKKASLRQSYKWREGHASGALCK